jgi:hypothetical protein
VLAVVGLAACARRSESVFVTDTTTAQDAVEVLAVERDPSTLVASPRVGGDSLYRFEAAARAADSLDARFQSLRRALNDQARSMGDADRRAPAYRAAFDRHQHDVTLAEAARAERDRTRRVRDDLRSRLGPRAAPARAEAVDSAARALHVRILRAPLTHGAAQLALDTGRWWIVRVRRDGALLFPAVPYTSPGAPNDTVRLPASPTP